MEEKVEKKGKLYFLITFIVCIVVAFGSFALGVQYAKQNNTNNIISCSYAVDNQATAMAITDGSTSVDGIYLPVIDRGNGDVIVMDYHPVIRVVANGSNYDIRGFLDIAGYTNLGFSGNHFKRIAYVSTQSQNPQIFETTLNYTNVNLTQNHIFFQDQEFKGYLNQSDLSQTIRSFWFSMWYSVGNSSGFGNIVGYQFGYVNVSDYNSLGFYAPNNFGIGTSYSRQIALLSLFDIDNNRITIACAVETTDMEHGLKTVYLEFMEGGNYSQGYQDGYEQGQANGNTDGYSRGYDSGYEVGKNAGYNLGLQDGSDYSFLGLISATIDAPIQAFRGLFNFSIFGVNMSQFMLSLFSIAIVFVIVRFVLAKKE